MKKDTNKWCEFHRTPTLNMNECHVNQALVAKVKDSETNACSNSELEPQKETEKGKKIIDVEPTAMVATTKLQKAEPGDLVEGERLFDS